MDNKYQIYEDRCWKDVSEDFFCFYEEGPSRRTNIGGRYDNFLCAKAHGRISNLDFCWMHEELL